MNNGSVAANEVEVAKRKVRNVYPRAVFYRGVCGHDSVILNTDKRPWIAISSPNDCGDACAAWLDAASRLPKDALPPVEVIDVLAYDATGNHEEAEEVAAAIRKIRAEDAGVEEPAKHEFRGAVGYGVCDECGREKNDYEYHSEPAKVTEACGSTKAPKGWACTRNVGHEGPCAAAMVAVIDDNDPPVCQRCESEYNLRDGYEVSKYCDTCAQELVTQYELATESSLPVGAGVDKVEQWLDLPTSQGYWFHTDCNPDVRPFIYHVQVSKTGADRYFIDFPDSRWCDHVGGKWMKVVEPLAPNDLAMICKPSIRVRLEQAEAALAAMAEDRNLWQQAHDEDCPNAAVIAERNEEIAKLKALVESCKLQGMCIEPGSPDSSVTVVWNAQASRLEKENAVLKAKLAVR